jgi:hypothetical protein
MEYKIVRAAGHSVTLWDGVTRDADHPNEMAGLMTIDLGPHTFLVGDVVTLTIKLHHRQEKDTTTDE